MGLLMNCCSFHAWLVRLLVALVVASVCLNFLVTESNAAEPGGAVAVKLVQDREGSRLLRAGKPHLVKGAGGDSALAELAAAGGNSLRTWGADKVGPLLDEAQQHGLTVAVGIWLGHERHGFNYNDADQVSGQLESAREVVLKYKDHPAVLLWGVGNEMEGYGAGDNAAIWSAINNMAAMIKELDPNHPTMTVVAEIGGDRVKNVHRLCPSVDILGINSYGGAATLPARYKQAGGTKPYILTEFGPPGIWESAKNAAGLIPEPSSTEKADLYRKAYAGAVSGAPGVCLGSYVFNWGHKQEATATWFGMFLPDGTRLAAVDAMTELWSGKPPANRCPRIESLTLTAPEQVDPGTTLRATLAAADPERDPLKVRWVLQAEPETLGVGGDAEAAPPTFPEAILKSDLQQAEVKLPASGGGYRLFAYVTDSHGNGAVANVPLSVKGPVVTPDAPAAKLPLVLYDEAGREKLPFAPSGWMGNTKAVKVVEDCSDNPHAGQTCLKVDYLAAKDWAGVVWQSPAGDWGDRAGGWNLTGATRLTFWARGAQGGEVVNFEFGLLGDGKRYRDSGRGKLEKVALTSEWKEYTLDLKGQDLSRIKTGFAWTLAADGKPVTFYLDDIQFE